MGIELGMYHDKAHLKEMIDRFTPEQLESLYNFMTILDKGFSGERGPEGKVIRGFMNMSFEKTSEMTTTAKLPIRWEMYNGIGIVHGGITATFVDNAMGRTLAVCYPGELSRQVTLDLNIHYIKGGGGSVLIAESELLQAGKNIAVVDCFVRDEEGDLVSKATGTFKGWPKKD